MSSKSEKINRSTSDFIRNLINVFGDASPKKNKLLAETGISNAQLSGRKSEISPQSQSALIANMTKEFGADWVFRYAKKIRTEIDDELRQAMMLAPSLSDALNLLVKFNHTRERTFYFEQFKIDGKRYLLFDLVFDARDATQAALEIVSIDVYRFVRSAWDSDWRGLEVWFPFKKPGHAQFINNQYACPVKYSQRRFGFVFPEEICERSNPNYKPTAYNQAVLSLYKTIGMTDSANEFVLSVKNHLGAISNHRPNAEETAAALRVSRRTLNRRLTLAGTSYRSLLDHSLKARAEKLLTETRLSRAEIAERLGYTDQTSFSRALKRWRSLGD